MKDDFKDINTFVKNNLRNDENFYIDSWICSFFRVLPTNKDFIRLTQRQKVILFLCQKHAPIKPNIVAWDEYIESMSSNSTVTPIDKELLDNMGYSSEDIVNINKEVENFNARG